MVNSTKITDQQLYPNPFKTLLATLKNKFYDEWLLMYFIYLSKIKHNCQIVNLQN